MPRGKIHLANNPHDTTLKDEDASTWTLCGRRSDVKLVRSSMSEEVTCGMCKRLVRQKKTWSRQP